MKLLFISDTHIGAKRYNLDFFHQDIIDSLKYQLNLIEEYDIDYVIHCGDLFDSIYVQANELYDLISVLKTHLTKPMYIIPGNHDVKGHDINNSFLKILEESLGKDLFKILDFGNITYLNKDENIVKLFPLPYIYPSKAIKDYQNINNMLTEYAKQIEKDKFNLLIGHQDTLSLRYYMNISNEFMLDPEFFKPFDLTMLGHYHNATVFDDEYKYAYIGSSYPLSFKQAQVQKGAYVVEIKNNKLKSLEFMSIQNNHSFCVEEVLYLNITNDLEKFIKSIKEKYDKNTILKLKVYINNPGDLVKFREMYNKRIKPVFNEILTHTIVETKIVSNAIDLKSDIEFKSKIKLLENSLDLEKSLWDTISKKLELDDKISNDIYNLYNNLKYENLPKSQSAILKRIYPRIKNIFSNL